ncbi:hypothetical protein [Zhihengliuella halotolerans]|uniref:hypothetical protein n=1 Tax=Zhihengliuella halotolerans TaxID=370736 RepID=UPI00102C5685|nr:hypothetical protein [Zhihengliuella halotolerans]
MAYEIDPQAKEIRELKRQIGATRTYYKKAEEKHRIKQNERAARIIESERRLAELLTEETPPLGK